MVTAVEDPFFGEESLAQSELEDERILLISCVCENHQKRPLRAALDTTTLYFRYLSLYPISCRPSSLLRPKAARSPATFVLSLLFLAQFVVDHTRLCLFSAPLSISPPFPIL